MITKAVKVGKYIHKKSPVTGIMYDGTNEREVKAFLKRVPHSEFLRTRKKDPIIVFSTLGAMDMGIGDYVVQTETGDQYVVDKKDFATYYSTEGTSDKHLPWEMLKQRYINKCNRLEKDSLEYKIAKHMLDEIRELERTYK